MRLGLLGPLKITDDTEGDVVVPNGRLKALLAALLTRANQPVPLDELVEIVWDGGPTTDAVRTVRVYLGRLRRALGPAVAARIRTQAPGYLCKLDEDELDLLRFEHLCGLARSAAHDEHWQRAAELLDEALSLWRGTPLVDIPSDLLRAREIPRLERLRLQAVEDHVDAQIHLGRHEHLIPQLRDLTAQHPLREHLHAQLMRTLAGTGRRAEALTAYQNARRVLIDQLGIEPGPELNRLQERILAGDAGLLPPRSAGAARPGPANAVAPPRQLPASVRHFVGRSRELKVLSSLLTEQAEAGGGTAVISAIDGTAGIGKTELAVHWGRQNAHRFPDGQLYVNLRGFDPKGPPLPPSSVMRGFLTALGVPARHIPVDPDEQAALYRSHLADRQMLVVLDNARDAEQVQPLLPGSPGSLVLVTSRSRLASLVALNGAVPVPLDLLTEHDARDLLIRRLGQERVSTDERTAEELIRLCARLPLALNIAAAHAALHPTRPLADLVDELRDAYLRLDALTTGEAAADVRAVFYWSYRTLAPDSARMFRLLGINPGPDIGLRAAASLTALDPDHARRTLDELTRAHLITEHSPGRYAFHDLLRAYAADQANVHDSEEERREALRRVCDFYMRTAHRADQFLAPHRVPTRLAPPAPGTLTHPLGTVQDVMAWFEAEYTNLLAAQQAAVAHAWHLTVWQLAYTLGTFQFRRVHRHDELVVWQAALAAAAHLPDPVARTRAHRLIGRAYAELGRHKEAVEHLNEALAVLADHPDPLEQAHTYRQLGWIWDRRGDTRQALHHATRALDLYRELDQPIWEANALNQVGWYCAHLGQHDTAYAHCQAGLALHRHHRNLDGEANTLDSLGYIDHHTGRHHQAVEHFQQALSLYQSLDNAYQIANTTENLGYPHAALGDHEQARKAWHQALELYREQGRTGDAERVERRLDADRPAGRT